MPGLLGYRSGGRKNPTVTPVVSTYLASASSGAIITAITDPYSGRGTTTFTTFGTVPPQLALSGTNIVVGSTLASSNTSYSIGILATAGDGLSKVGETITLTATGAGVTKVSISGTPSQAAVGVAYTFTPTVSNGSGTKSYSLTTGTLPAGLSLNTSTGAITGTPTTAATTSGLNLTVSDSTGTATLTFAITVIAALAISGTPTSAQLGTAYSFTPTVTGGSGTKTFALTTGSLPSGLSMSSSTGALTGTPTASGSFTNISIRVTDTSGNATLGPFTLTVASAATTKFVEIPSGSTSFTMPSDLPSSFKVHAFGAGGRGYATSSSNNSKGGGGGGAYAMKTLTGFTPSQVVNCQVGPTLDTWFSSSSTVFAPKGTDHGGTQNVSAPGGLASNAIGDTVYSGGTGALQQNFSYGACSGGGGAAGPNGAGADGGQGSNSGGGGGGGANGGTGGVTSTTATGANGGLNRLGTGNGSGGGSNTAGSAGTNGGGGGGSGSGATTYAGSGSMDPVFTLTAGGTRGPGSGSGGACYGAPAGLVFGYGGGTGGTNSSTVPASSSGGIIIEYVS